MENIQENAYEFILKIFNSGDSRRLSGFYTTNIDVLLSCGIIDVCISNIPIINTKNITNNGGGEIHNKLCSIMGNVVTNIWYGEPKYEDWHNNKKVDIYDCKNNIIIECGDTDPDSLRYHLLTHNCVIIVPFQKILAPIKEITIYKFYTCCKKTLIEFNESLIQECVDKFKKSKI